ncbi:hypothetical protein [Pseudacidobacterium ailaaui]|uniref:hypothetical protein n=1 Tax=Pseudacidobacterium ailaaui TaxID=1382359 RepID=UPI0012DC05E8|nr:hypothetical protein [Pseudacidobacterium ailaaui]
MSWRRSKPVKTFDEKGRQIDRYYYQNAPQCSACNREAVQGVVKRRYRPTVRMQ